MTSPVSDLLSPSLPAADRHKAAPYSLQAAFLSAFFGGPFAALGMLAVNARRTGRLRQDAGWIAGCLVLGLAWFWWSRATDAGQSAMVAFAGVVGERAGVLAERALALCVFLVGAALHRAEQRATDLHGLARPNGWKLGIVLIVAGTAASRLLERSLA